MGLYSEGEVLPSRDRSFKWILQLGSSLGLPDISI